jgi:hypothetical protein
MGLRGILIAVGAAAALTAAAAWGLPRFVNTELVRDQFEQSISTLSGGRFEVEGAVDAALFPRPRLIFAKARLLAPSGDTPIFAVDRIEMRPDLRALLSGELRMNELRLVRPRLDLTVARGDPAPPRTVPWGVLETIALRRLAVIDGRVDLPARGGGRISVEGIALEGRADSLLGPWTMSGAGRAAAESVTTELELGRISRDGGAALRAEVALGDAVLTYAGRVWLAAGPLRLDGRMTATAPRWETLRPLVPETIPLADGGDGPVALDATIRIGDGDLRIEQATLRSAAVRGGGTIVREAGRWTAELALERLDLDALAGLATAVAASQPVQPPVALRLTAGEVVLPGATVLADVDLVARRGAAGPVEIERLRASLPGRLQLRAQGLLATEPTTGPAFEGGIVADGQDLRTSLQGLGVPAAALPSEGPKVGTLTGQLTLERQGLRLRAIDAQIDGSSFSGSIGFSWSGRPRLALALRTDRLALDPWWDPARAAFARSAGAPLDVAADLVADRVLVAGTRIDRVSLKASLEQGALMVRELVGGDAQSIRVQAVGRYDPGAGSVDVAIDAETPRSGRLLRPLGLAVAGLDRLDPLRLSATLRGPLDNAQLEAELDLASLRLGLSGTASLAAPLERFALSLVASAPDTVALARQLGAVVVAERGPALDLRLRAERQRPERIALELGVGEDGRRLRGTLDLEPDATMPRLSGRLETELAALRAAEIVWPLLAEPLGILATPPSSWPGAWPTMPLDWRWLGRASIDLSLALREPSGRTARLATMRQRDGRLDVVDLDLPLGDGRLTGTASLAARGQGADLQANLAASGVSVDLRDARLGRLDMRLQAGAQGRSLADLVRTLEGRIELDAAAITLPGPPSLVIERTSGALPIRAGQMVGPLAITLRDGTAPLAAELSADLAAWLVELTIPLPTGALRLLGPPGGLRPVPGAIPDGG